MHRTLPDCRLRTHDCYHSGQLTDCRSLPGEDIDLKIELAVYQLQLLRSQRDGPINEGPFITINCQCGSKVAMNVSQTIDFIYEQDVS